MAEAGKWWQLTVLGGALVATIGCGRTTPDAVPLGEVTGVVKLDGEPFAGALVEFNPQVTAMVSTARGPTSSGSIGVTGPDGSYKLQFNNDRSGAVLGAHTVRVTEIPEDEGPPRKPRIPPKIASRAKYNFEVKPGSNTFDVDVKTR